MSTHDLLKQQYLEQEALHNQTRWNRACSRAREVLHHQDADVRALAKAYLTVTDSVRRRVHRSTHSHPDLFGVEAGSGVVGILETMWDVVWYRMYKHVEMGVGYVTSNELTYDYEACDAYREGATPYFHANLEHLREADPDAELLTPKKAVEILSRFVQEEAEFNEWALENEPEEHQPTEEDILLAALVEEFLATPA